MPPPAQLTGQPKQQPIEVKVTIRPARAKTPPPKLMITPVKLGQGQSLPGGARKPAVASTSSPGGAPWGAEGESHCTIFCGM